jgi:Ca-activated chloride channel family protein
MTFLSPWRLVLLLAPIALVIAYLVMQRRRHRTVVRFTSVDLLASVAPRRPGWQRHVPAVGLSLALVALVVGFARPAVQSRVARQRGTLVLALDTSNSMGATDVTPNRLAAAQQAARTFVNGLPKGLQVGLLSFDRTARVLAPPTSDRQAVLTAIDHLALGPGTATGDAIYLALDAIASMPRTAEGKPAPAVVVLMSDGTPTIGRGDQAPEETVAAASDASKQANVPIDTIAFGTDTGTVQVQGRTYHVPADPAALAKIADRTSGKAFTAQTGSELRSVYGQIAKAVGFDVQDKEITAWFTGIGLLLAIATALAALIWTQRLV